MGIKHSFTQSIKLIQVIFTSLLGIAAGALLVVALHPQGISNAESETSAESENFLNLELPVSQEVLPKLSQDELAHQILSDYQERIGYEFAIPKTLFDQTKFWFRVYTEFDSNKKIIHDSLNTHIIYDVVDISNIMALPANAKWLNVVKAEKTVARRTKEIQIKLRKMANKSKAKMDEEELGWYIQFAKFHKNTKKAILRAAANLRVQTGQKDFFESGLSISGRYLEGMETIFKAKKLPLELTRLPFVESSFAIGATSKVGAAGIWQFMPGIGRQFMTVNNVIDERRNPWKATEAAAKLLKENHLILHRNWGLALTAYNHGPAGLKKAIKATGSKDIGQIVRNYRSKNFDFASANFFTCFLAAMHAEKYKDVLWANHDLAQPLKYESIKLKKSLRSKQLAKSFGLTTEQILLFNPELDLAFQKNFSIPKGFRLFIPGQAGSKDPIANNNENETD